MEVFSRNLPDLRLMLPCVDEQIDLGDFRVPEVSDHIGPTVDEIVRLIHRSKMLRIPKLIDKELDWRATNQQLPEVPFDCRYSPLQFDFAYHDNVVKVPSVVGLAARD